MHKETVFGKVNFPAPVGKIATATRVLLSEIKSQKHIEKITDISIRRIFENHIINYMDDKGEERFDLAFNSDGIDELNKNIKSLNNGKKHQPIYKVRLYEVGNKFNVGNKGSKKDKYVEAAEGTNLFFAVYVDEYQDRSYKTIPLNEVVEIQKQNALLPRKERSPVPINDEGKSLLFYLSPNDLVYVPTEEKKDNIQNVDFNNLTIKQKMRIYKFVDASGTTANFIQHHIADLLLNFSKKDFNKLTCKGDLIQVNNKNKSLLNEIGLLSTNNKSQNTLNGKQQIKNECIKLKVDRLGNIIKVGEY